MKLLIFTTGIAAAMFVASFSVMRAQLPRTISYQGVLTDGSGNFIADGSHLLVLKLYDNLGGTSPIYIEAQSVTVVKGIFNLIIGTVTAIPASVAFDRPYYLGVSVDGGNELAPRAAISAVPYALRAATADAVSPGATGVVASVNGKDGALTVKGTGGTTVTNSGGTITIASPSGGGSLSLPFAGTANSADAALWISNAGMGKAGIFAILDSNNNSNAMEISTVGGGYALYALRSTSAGTIPAILGETRSAGEGTDLLNAATGVEGTVVPDAPGGFSAGVRGVNHSLSGVGMGVAGYQGGSGRGVYGETPNGIGVYGLVTGITAANAGVRGETSSPAGVAVIAAYSGAGLGTALQVQNGALKVSGTNKPAFTHVASALNTSGNITTINNALTNGDSTAILVVTHTYIGGATPVYSPHVAGVWYDNTAGRWTIFHDDQTAIPAGTRFNVWVIKQ